MYNPQKVFDLIDRHGLIQKDVVSVLRNTEKGKCKGNLRQIIDRDIRVSTLEKIADYFKVSIDVFFDREVEVNGVMINGEGHNIKNISVEQPSAHADNLQALLDEKDKRIKLLEEMVEIYKKRPEEK